MCVKLCYKNGSEKKFSPEKDMASQIDSASKVIVDYRSEDRQEVMCLLSALKEIVRLSVVEPFEIEFQANNYIDGMKLKKEAKKIEKSMIASWAVKTIVLEQVSVDSQLAQIEDRLKKLGKR